MWDSALIAGVGPESAVGGQAGNRYLGSPKIKSACQSLDFLLTVA